jgi:putative ABC transport system permease protein
MTRRLGNEGRPPELARRIVRWAVGGEAADQVQGELLEAFRSRAERGGRSRARAWYWRQAMGFALRARSLRTEGEAYLGADERKERGSRRVTRLDEVLSDGRWAVRAMRKRPTFTLVAVATLALGIGANSAIFTLVDAQFAGALPYEDPGGLVFLWETDRGSSDVTTVAPGNYFAWKEETSSFTDVAAFNVDVATLSGDGTAERVTASVVTPDFFSVLGVKPELGTTFSVDAAREADGDLVVLGHDLWVRRYGADPAVVGRTIRIDGRPHTVVGVLPATFRQPERDLSWQRAELWRPLLLEAEHDDFHSRYLRAVARLRPDVTPVRAQAEMAAMAERMAEAHPQENAGRSILVKSMDRYLLGDARPVLVLLLIAGAAVFLIVCANVANLTLARGQERRAEFAVRAALGAGQGRLLRQIVVEGVVLALAGAAVGTTAVLLGRGGLASLQERYFSGLVTLAVDARVVLFTVLAALLGGILFALPLARSARALDLRNALVEGGGRAGAGRAFSRARGLLVTGQVALATTLVVIGTLLTRSFDRLVSVPPGFQPAGRVAFDLSAPRSRYPERAEYIRYFRDIEREVSSVPGVRSVAMTSDLPFTTENDWTTFGVEGRPYDERTAPRADFHVTLPGYFGVMGIPVLQGRLPAEVWEPSSDTVAVVNRHMAEMIAPGGEALGSILMLRNGDDVMRLRVVAVVGDVLDDGFSAKAEPIFYVPYATWPQRSMSVVAQVQGDPADVMRSLRLAVSRVDPDIPAAGLETLDDLLQSTVARPRAASLLGGLFALIAVLVAVTGIYGMISYTVQGRIREMGIRAALGASGGELVRMVLVDSSRSTILGLAAGLGGAFAAASALSGLLFGVSPWDPLSYLGSALVLGSVATLAAWLPARRAVRADPREALKSG